MAKSNDKLSELVKNSIGKEVNNVVPIFYSGFEFTNAVGSLRNSALFGRWMFSKAPNEVILNGTQANLFPFLVLTLLGKTVAAIDLANPDSSSNPEFDILFDGVYLATNNLDAVTDNVVAGTLTLLGDVPPGGVIVDSTLQKDIYMYNDSFQVRIGVKEEFGPKYWLNANSSIFTRFIFPLKLQFTLDNNNGDIFAIIFKTADGYFIAETQVNYDTVITLPVALINTEFPGHGNVGQIRISPSGELIEGREYGVFYKSNGSILSFESPPPGGGGIFSTEFASPF
jgi:hypothetical protein